MAGRTRCSIRSMMSPPLTALKAPLEGSHGRPCCSRVTEKMRMRIRPIQNCGTAKPATETTVMVWSALLPRRSAPTIPSGIASSTPIRIAVPVSSSVLGSRSRMWLMTVLPSIIERPKSPWRTPQIQVRYHM